MFTIELFVFATFLCCNAVKAVLVHYVQCMYLFSDVGVDVGLVEREWKIPMLLF
jgi:hypothetical protein